MNEAKLPTSCLTSRYQWCHQTPTDREEAPARDRGVAGAELKAGAKKAGGQPVFRAIQARLLLIIVAILGFQMPLSAQDAPALSSEAVVLALEALPGWTHQDDALAISWVFPSFTAAMAFMQSCVVEIEAQDHHPEWKNVYQRVEVRLTTHDVGNRVTAKDVQLAAYLSQQAGQFQARVVTPK